MSYHLAVEQLTKHLLVPSKSEARVELDSLLYVSEITIKELTTDCDGYGFAGLPVLAQS